jgi:hypothetical protein
MDRPASRSLWSAMARRNVFDPPERTREARWYGARDGRSALLEVRALPAGSDLKRIFVAAMLERIDARWRLGEFSSRGGSVFFTRGAERCMVGIEAADPDQPVSYGAAHLVDSPTRPCR